MTKSILQKKNMMLQKKRHLRLLRKQTIRMLIIIWSAMQYIVPHWSWWNKLDFSLNIILIHNLNIRTIRNLIKNRIPMLRGRFAVAVIRYILPSIKIFRNDYRQLLRVICQLILVYKVRQFVSIIQRRWL